MMKTPIFTGAGVAIVTPMNADGSVNYDMLRKHIDFQIANHTDAIIICGTTGESSTLTDEEHKECIRVAVEQTGKRVPVIAGTGSNDTAYAIHLSKEAQELGADGLLVVTPYYNKTSQRGLAAHFTAIADSVDIPVILYNIPGRTGMKINVDTCAILAGHPNIVGLKEATGNISDCADVIAACGENLAVYSGNDDQVVPIMSLGGKGVISVLSNILPRETHDMAQYCLDNQYPAAAALQIKYLPLIRSLFMDVNPIPVKEALNLMGWNVGECRLPLLSMTDAQVQTLKNTMKDAGLPV